MEAMKGASVNRQIFSWFQYLGAIFDAALVKGRFVFENNACDYQCLRVEWTTSAYFPLLSHLVGEKLATLWSRGGWTLATL